MRKAREDPVVDQILEDYRRAGASLILAIGFFVGWVICRGLTPPAVGPAAGVAAPLALAISLFGWGSLFLTVLAGFQYSYAYLYVRSKVR
jgi:hypothetical protein